MRLIVVGDCVSLKRKTHSSSANSVADRSVDWKGIKRGACREKHCADCDTYVYNPAKGSQCQYCGCYPTKHSRIDDFTTASKVPRLELEDEEKQAPEICIIDNGSDTLVYEVDDEGNVMPDDNPLEVINDQLPSRINAQIEPTILKTNATLSNCASVVDAAASSSSLFKSGLLKNKDLPPKTLQPNLNLNNKLTFEKILQQLSRDQLYEFCVPSSLPMRINFPTDVESLSKSDAEFIIRWIAWSMWNLHVTSEQDFIQVATLALKRYPTLESIFPKEKGLDGMVDSLKEFLGHKIVEKKRNKKKELEQVHQKQLLQQNSGKENAVSNLKQYETLKSHIYKEMEKSNPSISVLRTFLSSCRKERKLRLSINKQDYSTQLQEFPCLQIQELVIWEFISQAQLQCTVNDLKKRWSDAVPSMACYFLSQSEKTYDEPLTEDEATLEILQCLTCPTHFGESEERYGNQLVLEVFNGSVLPSKQDPPRLFCISGDENQTTYVYVEGKAIFKGAILDALIYIVAIYFVFDFSPSPEANDAFSFIFGVLMKEKFFDKCVPQKPVVAALEAVFKSK